MSLALMPASISSCDQTGAALCVCVCVCVCVCARACSCVHVSPVAATPEANAALWSLQCWGYASKSRSYFNFGVPWNETFPHLILVEAVVETRRNAEHAPDQLSRLRLAQEGLHLFQLLEL